MRWNAIPGLSLEHEGYIDELAHGLVTPESLEWICQLAAQMKDHKAKSKEIL